MKPQSEHDATLARYLLGTLPEEDSSRIEEQALRDDELFARLESVADDLIDAYVRDELGDDDRRAFEERFSTHPDQRERVAFAIALRDLVAARAAAVPPERLGHPGALPVPARWPRAVLAVAAVLLIAIAGWLAFENQRLDQQLGTIEEDHDRLAAENQQLVDERQRTAEDLTAARQRVAELDQQLSAERDALSSLENRLAERPPQVRPPLTVAFILGLGTRAADGLTMLRVPEGAEQVELQIDVEGSTASRFRALLRTAIEEEVWGRDLTLSQDGAVVLEIPAAVLSPGRYVLTLLERDGEAFEELAFFDLEVVRAGS